MTAPVLARLQELAAEARASGRVVRALVTGAEGLGRSHTLKALAAALAPHGFTVLSTSPDTGPVPAALVRALAPDLPADDAGLLEALRRHGPVAALGAQEQTLAAELVASLLGRPAQAATAGLDAESRREGAFAEVGRWLTLEGARAPVAVLVDDGDLADADSAAFIDFLAHLGDALPLVLVVTADADARALGGGAAERLTAWRSEPGWERLALPDVAPQAMAALLAGLGLSPAQADVVTARAGGNPGRAARLAQVLLASPDSPLPATPEALRLWPVQRLGEAPWALARRAALLGDVLPLAALEAVGAASGEALEALLEAGVLRRVAPAARPQLRFADGRTRVALAATVPPAEATALRAAAARWAKAELERTPADDFPAVASLVPMAVPALDDDAASLWAEARAAVVADRAQVLEALVAAASAAQGVRRLVLLRRIGDLQVLAGQPERALETVRAAPRQTPAVSPLPGVPAGRAVATWVRSPLDRWHALMPEAAVTAVELTRAEALSHLVKKEDTQAAFQDLERRLTRLKGDAAAQLWVRWAKSWTWFLCEILRRPQDALKACAAVRLAVPKALLSGGELALGLVRAEEVAKSTAGDFTGAAASVDEHLALAQAQGNLREGCLAWNARAILHFGQGELAPARLAFEKAIEQARATGWLRRDAISTHNLALVLTELGAYDEAYAAETRYAKLSVVIGNHAGTAEAPAVLAGVALGRRDAKAAEPLIAQALKAAEANGWAMLLAWGRVLSGRLKVLHFLERRDALDLTRAKNDLLAALDALEEHSAAWSEELDPGEVYALYAAIRKLSGQVPGAKDVLERGRRLVPKENVVSHRALDVGQAFVEGQGLAEALGWFDARGYARLVGWWRALAG